MEEMLTMHRALELNDATFEDHLIESTMYGDRNHWIRL